MKTVFMALIGLAGAAPAYAQNVGTTSPFGGARIEGRVGWDRPVASIEADDIEANQGKSGVVYGGEIGFDVPQDTIILGVYAGLEGSSTKSCFEFYGRDEACVRAGRNITAGARVGVQLGVRTMVYAKGGYSNGKLKASYVDFDDAQNNLRYRPNLDGFHLGAGAEANVSANVYGKLEYVYTNYNAGRLDNGDFGFTADLERHQVVAGVGIRF
jgi:outer membrane immunogenic protein